MSRLAQEHLRTVAVAAGLGALLGVVVGASLVAVVTSGRSDPARGASLDAQLSQVLGRLDALEHRPGAAEDTARMSVDARAPVAGVDNALLERLVAEQLRRHGLLQDHAADAGPDAGLSAEAALQLLAAIPPSGDRGAVWARIRAAGRLDQVLAALERRVAESPRDPDARVELGLARIQKMLAMADGPERIALGESIDQAFTEALQIDPQHWEARFRKAEGLSYWPPLSGKAGEAIRHFEQLVDQQNRIPASPEQARTYLFLGNLYERQGQLDKAAAVWAKGAQRHAGDAELQRKLQEARR